MNFKETLQKPVNYIKNMYHKDTSTGTDAGDYKIPHFPYKDRYIYDVANYSSVLNNILQTIQTELFKNGWEFIPKYEYICTSCGREYDHEPEQKNDEGVPICSNCGNIVTKPDKSSIRNVKKQLRRDVNYNNQTLTEVLKEIEWDLDAYDSAYLYLEKNYEHDSDGKLVNTEIDEIVKLQPIRMRIIKNDRGMPATDQKGDSIRFCPEHRGKKTKRDYCEQCGRETLPTYFVKEKGEEKKYFSNDEVKHLKKYRPTEPYGWSPVIPLWQKIHILYFMNRDKPPKGPKNFAKYTEMRNGLKKEVDSTYGVMPLFQGNLEGVGGLNNEGQEITITNSAMRKGQEVFNKKLFPWLCDQLSLEHWTIELNEVETRDVAQEKQQINQRRIQNAVQMSQIGFNVELDEKEDNKYVSFKYSGKAEKPSEQ